MTGHIRKRATKGGISWQIILEKGVDATGKRIRDYITVDGAKKDAQRILNEKINEFNKGTYIEPSQMTVEEHLNEWIETYAKPNLSPSTVRGYLVNIKKHTLPYIGQVPLQKLIPLQVQRMFEQLQAKGLAPRTIKYVHSTLREALQHAFKMQLIPRNPADFVTLPKQVKYKATAYEENEAVLMLEKAKNTDIEAPLHLGVGLGLRRGELLGLRWSDIDFETNKLTVNQNLVYIDGKYIFRQPKSESGNRTIEMPSSLSAILKKHKKKQLEYKLFFGKEYKDNGLVCCKPDGSPHNPGSFSHKFEKFLKANGLRQIRLHDLRHTNASLCSSTMSPPKSPPKGSDIPQSESHWTCTLTSSATSRQRQPIRSIMASSRSWRRKGRDSGDVTASIENFLKKSYSHYTISNNSSIRSLVNFQLAGISSIVPEACARSVQ